MAVKNYYLILGVSRSESQEGIRAAFRELAKRYHPDRAGVESTPEFREILEAYEVLSDPERRRQYNRELEASEAAGQGPRRAGKPVRPVAGSPSPVPSGAWQPHPWGQVIPVEAVLDPLEAALGAEREIDLPITVLCPACLGAGAEGWFPCLRCLGQGRLRRWQRVRVSIPPCLRHGATIETMVAPAGAPPLWLRIRIRVASY